jgi:hypothetical protein
MFLLHEKDELTDVFKDKVVPINDSAEIFALHAFDAHQDKKLMLICKETCHLASPHSKSKLETGEDKHDRAGGCLEFLQVVVLTRSVKCWIDPQGIEHSIFVNHLRGLEVLR